MLKGAGAGAVNDWHRDNIIAQIKAGVAAYDNGTGGVIVAGGSTGAAPGTVVGDAVWNHLNNNNGISTGADTAAIALIANNAGLGAIIGQGDANMQAAIQAGIDAADEQAGG